MNPVVFALLVALVMVAALSWRERFGRLAWVSAGGLALVLAVAYGASGLLPASPELHRWGVVASVALATVGGGPVASALLRRVVWTQAADATDDPPVPLRGGRWIGLLERLAIAGAVASGYPAGIAVVLAVKGLGRYPELRHGNAEQFIVGTLASMLYAVAAAGVPFVG